MNLLTLLLVVFVLLMIFGNPLVGGRVWTGYNYGYWPGGLGLIVVIVLLVLLLR
jgi:uncharacterized membrane protein